MDLGNLWTVGDNHAVVHLCIEGLCANRECHISSQHHKMKAGVQIPVAHGIDDVFRENHIVFTDDIFPCIYGVFVCHIWMFCMPLAANLHIFFDVTRENLRKVTLLQDFVLHWYHKISIPLQPKTINF